MLHDARSGPANPGDRSKWDRSDGNIVCRYDSAKAMIVIISKGRWTVDQVDKACTHAADLVARMRRRGEPVRVLVDRSGTEVQSDAASERLLAHTRAIFAEDDRVAVLVDDSLAKTRSRASLSSDTHQLFASSHAAMTWLKAHD